MKRSLSFALLLLLSGTVLAQREAKVPDPDPELERKTFIVPEGFEVNLFAADPMLAKPIQMNFDPQGRLWIAASEVYPQIKPGQAATDKVLILEDTNGDGRADKTTVFADGLLIPTGVAPGDGGAYVADSTDLVHFSDPDPVTGKARRKRIVLSGFGTEDTHHILHTFRWGLDGMLYMSQSIYIHSHIETPHGVRRLNAGGIWQFRPETLELNVFARGFVNTWGTQFNRWGQSFATDGAYGEGINILMPGAYYYTASGATRILQGLNPGSPKHCGLAVLSGRHLPTEFQGNLVTNDFRGHRVCRFVLKDDGSGFVSQEQQELIKSSHPAFRPVDVAMGPDGAIYVADWYNPIIQHGEVDFRDPRRDKTHGRIWRITAKNRPLVDRPKLVGAPIEELLNHLKAPEDWTRQMAKQVLKERGAKAVLPTLRDWYSKLDPRHADFEHHRLEALWTYQTLNVVEPTILHDVLNSPNHRARAAACRVLASWTNKTSDKALTLVLDQEKLATLSLTTTDVLRAIDTAESRDEGYLISASSVKVDEQSGSRLRLRVCTLPGADLDLKKLLEKPILELRGRKILLNEVAVLEQEGLPKPPIVDSLKLLEARVRDGHPQVRLEAVRALAHIPNAKAAEVAALALDQPVDKWLDYALWLVFRELAPHWLPAVQRGELTFNNNPRHLVFALQATGSSDVVKTLRHVIDSGKIAADRLGDIWLTVAQLGAANDLLAVLQWANQDGHTAETRGRVLAAVAQSVQARRVARPQALQPELLKALLAKPGVESAAATLRLIGLWKVEELRAGVENITGAESTVPHELVAAAIDSLALLGGPLTIKRFEQLVGPGREALTQRLTLQAWANLDPAQAAQAAIRYLQTAPATPELVDLFAAFVNRKDGPATLTRVLTGQTLPAEVAKLGLKAAKAAGQPDAKLIAALTKAGQLTERKLVLKGADLDAFLTEVAQKGDPARGEAVYRRAELNCMKCHAIAGAGGQVGPDMTSIGASAQPDYLIESLLEPSAKIKEGYNTYIVTTVDERIFTGVRLRENDQELVLRDAEDREIVLRKADIESRKDGKSLMPEGLVDTLSRQELIDLTRFLSELGKGPYLAQAGQVVRRWQVLQPNSAMFTLLNRQRLAAVADPATTGLNWVAAYSQVNGELPVDAAPRFRAGMSQGQASVVRFQLDVSAAGPVLFKFNDTQGLTAWVNGVPIELASEVRLDVKLGEQTITLALDATRQAGLKVELAEAPGSPARARLK